MLNESVPNALLFLGTGDGRISDPIEVPLAAESGQYSASGDINNDGNLDFVLTHIDEVWTYLGNGDGTFTATGPFAVEGTRSIKLVDVNLDGNLDVYLTTFVNFVGAGAVILLGDGAGSFAPNPAYETEFGDTLVDIDGDGDLDKFAIAHATSSQTMTFQINRGDWTFEPAYDFTVPFGTGATTTQGTSFGDMNGDGLFDLVVVAAGQTLVYLADGPGQYDTPRSVVSGDSITAEINLIDFDGDGDLDVVVPRRALLQRTPAVVGGIEIMLNDGNGVLTDAIRHSSPYVNRGYAFADFDNNGVKDIVGNVTGNSLFSYITVVLGNPDGSLVAPLEFNLETIEPGFDIPDWEFGDLNGDGSFDILMRGGRFGLDIYSVLNQGDGEFGAFVKQTDIEEPSSLNLADLNNDGFADFIYGRTRGSSTGLPEEEEGIYIRFGNGDGTFGDADFYHLDRNPASVAIFNIVDIAPGDLNGDGHLDLLASAGHHSKVLLGNGDGTFQPATQLLVGGSTLYGPGEVLYDDFNNDGNLDMASAGVRLALGNGDGTFAAAQVFESGPTEADVALGDVNRDGKTDVVTSSRNAGGINVLLGDGAGGFGPVQQFRGDGTSDYQNFTLADFDQDGFLDVAVIADVPLQRTEPFVLLVFYNNGDGTYGEPLSYDIQGGQPLIGSGLFDGDDIPDIILGGVSHTITVITSKVPGGGAEVSNAPLGVLAHDLNPVAGTAFTTTVAAFTNDDTLALPDEHAASIDWGDGTVTDGLVIHSPAGGFLVRGTHTYASSGSFDVTVTVSDDGGGSTADMSTANVTGVDGAIAATPVVINAKEDTPFVGLTATFTDSDPLGALGDYTATIDWGDGAVSEGAIVRNGGLFEVFGAHTYTAGGVFNVTVTITDIGGGGDDAVSTANVESNQSPTALDDGYTVDEDGALIVSSPAGVLFNDEDTDGDALTVALNTDVTHGALSLNADGSFSYTPDANFHGVDTFVYALSDGRGGEASGMVSITVHPINDAPIAADDQGSTDEDTPVLIAVLTNDSDVDGDALGLLRTTAPAHGFVTLNADQSITYTPNANFHGVDAFSYTVYDGAGGFDLATVEVTVAPINDEPIAVADTATTREDMAVAIDVLANDSDADGDTLSVIALTQPTNGSVMVNAEGGVTYTPNTDFFGVDTFTYSIDDGHAGVPVIANVTVEVLPINDMPIAVGNAYAGVEDASLSVNAAAGVLSNDTDAEGQPLTAALVRDVANGVLQLNADGSFTYTPDPNFHGEDRFTYRAVDANGARSARATVTLTVSPVNDDPVSQPDTASTSSGVPVTIEVVSNDSDVDGDALTITEVTTPTKGDAAINPDGTIQYTPHDGQSGADSFNYTIDDGQGGQATATVTVNIMAPVVNLAPIANDDEAATDPDRPIIIGVLPNDVDDDGALRISSLAITSGPTNGAVSINTNGSVTYRPNAGFAGVDRFTYTVQDAEGATSNDAVVTVRVRSLVRVEAITPDASEAGPTDGVFRISRVGTTSGDLTVRYAVLGSAVNGEDYGLIQAFVVIPDGEASVIITVSPVDDEAVEGLENVSLVLARDGAYLVDGTQSDAAVNIADNDLVGPLPDLVEVTVNEGDSASNTGTLVGAEGESYMLTASIGAVTDHGDGTWTWSFDTTDGPDETQQVTITATDSNNVASSATFDLIVSNVAPLITRDEEIVSVDEGSEAVNTGAFNDPGNDVVMLAASVGVITDHGDGTWRWSLDTNDGPDKSQTVTVTAMDSDGAASEITFELAVNNVAPVVTAGADQAVDTGETVNIMPTFTDPGDDTHTATIDWGDGAVDVIDPATIPLAASHAYAAGGNYTVTVTVTDSDGAMGQDQLFVSVNAATPPAVTVDQQSVTVNEGQTAINGGTLLEPDGDLVTLTASLGVIEDAGDGTWRWSFDTTDGPDESQTVTITATDKDGSDSVTFELNVNNVAPTLTVDIAEIVANEADVAANAGTLTGPGDDEVSLNASVGEVTDNRDGTWSWTFSTTDGTGQSQTVTITATDEDGASTNVSFTLTVLNIAPTVEAGPDQTIDVGDIATITPSFSDPGEDAHTATIDWGDGAVEAFNPATSPIESSHVYADTGTYVVTVTVIDSDGVSASDTLTLRVEGDAGGGTEGLSPGYWKTHALCKDDVSSAWQQTGYNPHDRFNEVFGVHDRDNPTLLEALRRGGGGSHAFARQAVAALLNAAHPEIDYAFSVAEVLAMTQTAYAGDKQERDALKDLLEAENSKGLTEELDPDKRFCGCGKRHKGRDRDRDCDRSEDGKHHRRGNGDKNQHQDNDERNSRDQGTGNHWHDGNRNDRRRGRGNR